MSNLRIIGLITGLLGLFLAFRIYRGPKWNRLNFVLLGVLSFNLAAVSLNPNLVNSIANLLALRRQYYGRILALLIFSNIFLWFLVLYLKTRLDGHKHQFDRLIMSLSREDARHLLAEELLDKEIMVIIPAYNEADSLKALLPRIPEEIQGRKMGIIVVDDGSSDATAEVVKSMGHLCISNKINRGQGAASRLGYEVLLQHLVSIGVTMDADGQHLPGEIEVLVQPVMDKKHDLVIGSRVLGKSSENTFLRRWGIRFLTTAINLLTGLKLTDCSSGFKAFNVEKIRGLHLREEQFQAAEIIIEAAKKGLRITEVPITMTSRKHGVSKKGSDSAYGVNFVKSIVKAWWK